MKLIRFLLLGCLFTGCGYFEKMDQRSDKERAIDEVYDKTISELYRKEKFYVSGTATTAMDEVKRLGIFFKIDRKMNLEEARRLFLTAHGLFLKNINQSEALRPYLKTYPFPEKDVEILISYLGLESCLNENSIRSVTNTGFDVYYNVNYPGDIKSFTIHKESIQEANRTFLESMAKKADPNKGSV